MRRRSCSDTGGLISIKGIGRLNSAILLSAIGRVQAFSDAGKLPTYFRPIRASIAAASTAGGNKLARTQRWRSGQALQPVTSRIYEPVRQRGETGKAIAAAARKLLTILYYTLRTNGLRRLWLVRAPRIAQPLTKQHGRFLARHPTKREGLPGIPSRARDDKQRTNDDQHPD
jgi:hypothetical protein